MAHRIITQLIFTGTKVFSRAFVEAYRQANHMRTARASASQTFTSKDGSTNYSKDPSLAAAHHGLTMDEACRILNVAPPKGGETDLEQLSARFKKLFDLNDPKRGGSFYLQSKILRARERIEAEVGRAKEKKEEEEEMNRMPKMYR